MGTEKVGNQTDKRKARRRTFGRPGWIDIGGGTPLRLCMINDLSDTGAGITLATEDNLPREFILLFSPRGRVGRRCRLVWQTGHRMGCLFTHRLISSFEVQAMRPEEKAPAC